jgi:hypothetical protein
MLCQRYAFLSLHNANGLSFTDQESPDNNQGSYQRFAMPTRPTKNDGAKITINGFDDLDSF